jgi:trans-2,3-dihydro-3-hydroxyanthranilate isomerase
MKKYHFALVDVFTDKPFSGNQLAVFTEPEGLSKSQMQKIAKELNFSESTFVFPPGTRKSGVDYRVRIFTPDKELPMAGHPTIGTAFVLSLQEASERSQLRLEEGVGIIPVSIEFERGAPGWVGMSQPLPKFGPAFKESRKNIANMLSLEEGALVPDLPLEVVSCGLPFLYVPLKDLHSVQRIKFRLDVWETLLKGTSLENVFVFTREVQNTGSFVHSRMFAPGVGIVEDPATGSASGPLGCYLVKNGVLRSSPTAEFVSEQGIEIGRPSKIRVSIGVDRRGEIDRVVVSGRTCKVGEGFIEL